MKKIEIDNELNYIDEFFDKENPLIGTTRYYYSETKPTDEGNYWHYDNNGNIVEW